MQKLGLRLNAKRSVLSPAQKTTFLGVVWKSVMMQSCLSPAHAIVAILMAMNGIQLRQSLTVKQFKRLLGLMTAVSSMIPFGLLYIRPLQWWLQTKRFSPRGQPTLHDQGYSQMHSYVGDVEEALVLVPRSRVRSSLSLRHARDRCISHRLGSGYGRPLRLCGGVIISHGK